MGLLVPVAVEIPAGGHVFNGAEGIITVQGRIQREAGRAATAVALAFELIEKLTVVLVGGCRCLVEGIRHLRDLLLGISALLLPLILIICRGIILFFRALTEIAVSLTLLIVGRIEKVTVSAFRIGGTLLFFHIQNLPKVIDRHSL